MEEPTKYTRKLIREPGRRYAAGRVAPRVGADVTSPATRAVGHQKIDDQSAKQQGKPRVQRNPATKPALPRTKRSQVLRRQMVERAQEQRSKVKKARGKHVLWYGFALIVIGALLTVLWSFREVLPFDIELSKQSQRPVNVIDSDTPEISSLDETAVSEADIKAHTVAVDAPRVIRVPKLEITARVRQVGTTLSNEPIAPKNVADVGWYEGSGKPGNEGAVLLNGHLAGPNRAGVFKNIHNLEPGDEITVERGDGQVFRYMVVRLQEYAGGQVDMSAALNPIDSSKPGLNLVTTLNKYSGTEKRVIVFALQRD